MNIGDAAFSRADIMRRLHELEGIVRELVAGRRLENASVGANGITFRGSGGITLTEGGGLTIRDDGALVMENDTGGLVVFMGADATGKQVFWLVREDGSLLLNTQGSAQWGRDFWSFWDNSGQIVLSDDAETGWGLAKPRLISALYPHFNRLPDKIGWHDGPDYVPIWECEFPVSNPWVRVGWRLITAVGEFAQVRIKIDDVVVYEADPSESATANSGRLDATDGGQRFFGGLAHVTVEGRRTSGSSNFRLVPLGIYAP